VTLSPELLGQLAAAFADELAPRIAAQLADNIPPAGGSAVEPWRLLTLAEAAERLGRSERWLRERKEQVGYIRLDGGALAFRLEELQAFAAARVVGGPSAVERRAA
jgi:hypothetical protein